MGIVSTALFAQHLRSQFHATILAESTRSPADIALRPTSGVSAVQVTFGPFDVRPLTRSASPVATRALTRAVKRMGPVEVIRLGRRSHWFPVPAGGPIHDLQAAARLIPSPGNVPRETSVLIVAEQSRTLTRQLRGLILIEMITGGGLLALLAIGGQWLIGRGLGPLAKMASTANDITARGDLTARMTTADDQSEVGRLGAAINTMLDRIQQAFGARLNSERKVREFAADASHELRTPLTTIRGYAELYRQGALGSEQLPGAMRRIEQEAQRMSTLVAELLELARLDRTSSLDLAETDLALVVNDAVADAKAVEPDRPISAEAPARLIAVVDERRIRQVLANLLANVRAHTPASAQVAVRLSPVRGGVLIEVADSGPGMSPGDAARAFDRFHRAVDLANGEADRGDDAQGAQADYATGGGSGLGLSIVQAIAAAHGGQATLESWQGHGTRVRIWLPAGGPVPAAT
ncbi:MAG: HAMP domain-containing histidine kinase [Nocardiopsaceae bacterium]|jgi:two-component system OmpR family sensor kinase|nr:HAMP domain-containing histidine kinase [Nocardiopsaceae bacterium]